MDTRTIYYRVVQIANIFVSKRAHLTIAAVSDFDPSVEEFAEIVASVAEMIQAIAGDFSDENMAMNAFQCSLDLHRLARAVLEKNQEDFESALDALAKYCVGPY